MRRDLSTLLALLLLTTTTAPSARAADPAPRRQTPAPKQQPAPAPPQQQPSPTPAPALEADDEDVVRVTANLVQFDATVTDRDGRLVTDLRPEEFEVLLDGKRQEISNFSFVGSAPAAGREAAPRPRPERDAPSLPPVPVRPAQVRRTIALVADDLGTSFTDLYYVRRALRKFVDEQMQPGDLVAVIQTGKGLGALQQFTTDKRILHRAIDNVRWNPMGRAGISTFAPFAPGPAAAAGLPTIDPSDPNSSDPDNLRERDERAAQEEFRQGVFAVGTVGALNFIVRGMGELPGRKSVILFSGGFPVFPDMRNPTSPNDTDRVVESLRRLADAANRAAVIIYTMDARGLVHTGPTAADSFSSVQQALNVLETRSRELVRNQEGLAYLAEQTGGIFIKNSNDLGKGVERALEDQKGFYLIGFRPPTEFFERTGTGPRFNKFEVKVSRPGVRVRTRAGFYGYPEGQAKPVPRTRAEQLMAALTSPLTSGELGLRLTSLFNSTADGTVVVDSLLHIDGSQLKLSDEPDGWKKAVFDVVALTFGENGQVVDAINRTETLRVRGDVLESLLSDGFVYVMKVPVQKPGSYQLRVAVRDAATERVGSASQFIEVPDLKQERLTLSGIFMTGADAAAPVPASAPAPASPAGAANPGGSDPVRDATVRRFRQGSFVDFRYHIYNAKLDRTTGRPRLQTQTRLFRDGQPVYASALQTYDPGPQPGAARLEAGRRLQLGTQLPPGEYVLQVVVTDDLAKGKQRMATQWIDFQIVK